jgi:magnesium transporter
MDQDLSDQKDFLATAASGDGASVDADILARAISDCLRENDTESVRIFLSDQHPADIAHIIDALPREEACRCFRLLPLERRARVLGYLDMDLQVDFARTLGRREFADIVTEMSSDERADLFNRLSPEQQEALLPALAQAEREDIRRLASYAEGTVGALMTSDYAMLTPDISAREALDRLRLQAPDKETIYRAYVVDPERRLIGSIRLQELILAWPGVRIADLMERNPRSVLVSDDQEIAAREIAKYDVLALPVVDGEGHLVGIVTHDDAMDVVEQEATEDFHKLGTVGTIVTSLKDASIGLLYRKRITWLVLLVFGNLFSGAGIAYYEDTIAAYVALVFFLPLLIGSGGNAGSQASTLMVRALATGDVGLRDWGSVLGREILVATALGATMAVAVSAIGLVRGGPEIALVVAMSMVMIVMIGSIIGMSLPFLFSRLNMDPAAASAPLVTVIADAVGVIIYFSIATTFLHIPGT